MNRVFEIISSVFRVRQLVEIFLLLLCNSVYSQSSWQWLHPMPAGNTLNSVDFINDQTGFAAGDLGCIIKTTDGGNSWKELYSGSVNNIHKIKFLNADIGICAGKNGLLMRTKDGGIHWETVTGLSLPDIHDIDIAGNTFFICGLNGQIMKSADCGNTWISINSQAGFPLFCISFLDEVTGVCGGYNIILKTTDGGNNWNALNAGIMPATQITGIKYTDSNKIYAAGNSPLGDFYFSNDGGSNWQRNSLGLQYLFGGSVDLVRAMDFKDADNGYIVTDLGTILSTSDGGSHWNKDSSQRFSYLKTEIFKNVSYNHNQETFFSGNGGRVLKMPDCGKELISLTGNNKNFYNSFTAENGHIYCTGDSGIILRKKTGSPEWEKIFISKDIILKSIAFSDPFTGFVCSNKGRIFRTSDGGDSWIEFSPGIKSLSVNKIFFKDKYNGFITGGIENSGKGIIYSTADGGVNWKINFLNTGEGIFNDIYFTDHMTGFAVGGNGSLASTFDGGKYWSLKSLIPYDFHSINFNRSGTGIITGENGVIYRTSDCGKSWQFISPVQYKNLNSVLFKDSLNVIAAGDDGVIIHSSDGGVTWQKMNSVTNNNLLSVNSDGKGIYAFGENGTVIYSLEDKKLIPVVAENINLDVKKILSLTSYPNPFNPETRISILIPERGFINLKIYDILGREVKSLMNEIRQAGIYHVRFNSNDLPGGIYFCRLEFDNTVRINRLILLK